MRCVARMLLRRPLLAATLGAAAACGRLAPPAAAGPDTPAGPAVLSPALPVPSADGWRPRAAKQTPAELPPPADAEPIPGTPRTLPDELPPAARPVSAVTRPVAAPFRSAVPTLDVTPPARTAPYLPRWS